MTPARNTNLGDLLRDGRRGPKLRHKIAPGADPSAVASLPPCKRKVFVFLFRASDAVPLTNDAIAQGTRLAPGTVSNAIGTLRRLGVIVSAAVEGAGATGRTSQ